MKREKRGTIGREWCITDVPFHVERLLREQAKRPDKSTLKRLETVQNALRGAIWNLRLLRSPKLRFWMSWWLVAGIFAVAILYAILYFVYATSGVPHPLSPAGASQIVDSAKAYAHETRSLIEQAGDATDAIRTFFDKLTGMVSKVPPLLAAIGAAYVGVRKLFARAPKLI